MRTLWTQPFILCRAVIILFLEVILYRERRFVERSVLMSFIRSIVWLVRNHAAFTYLPGVCISCFLVLSSNRSCCTFCTWANKLLAESLIMLAISCRQTLCILYGPWVTKTYLPWEKIIWWYTTKKDLHVWISWVVETRWEQNEKTARTLC